MNGKPSSQQLPFPEPWANVRMKFIHTVIPLAAALLLAACATPLPLDNPPVHMSVIEARQVLHSLAAQPTATFIDERDTRRKISQVVILDDDLRINDRSIPIQGLLRVSIDPPNVNFAVAATGGQQNLWIIQWLTNSSQPVAADRIASALLTLRQAAGAPEAPRSHFAIAAAAWRSATPKPALPEATRRAQVQAEAYVRDKQFLRAAETYRQALDETPAWPQGHFNFALALEALGDYELAIEEMQDYLALVPDAPNARAVQDKIYEWQTRLPR